VIDELIQASEAGEILYASPAFRDGHLDDADAATARTRIEEHPDHSGYHLLMGLRRDQPDTYAAISADVRAQVLAGALGHLRFLNDFGYLAPGGSFDAESAQVLLETGDTAIPALVPLLDDDRPAPSRGSETATVAKINQLRRCDYAYHYLMELTGEEDRALEPDLGVRDERIAQLREQLAARGGQHEP
jgi:hypothetical protein